MLKTCCFWAFSDFFGIQGPFFRTLNLKSAFLSIKCGMKHPKWPIYATSVQKQELSNLTKNEIVLPSKHGGGPGLINFPKWSLKKRLFRRKVTVTKNSKYTKGGGHRLRNYP